MPGPLIPKKSGVHRAACFALYRALLRQRYRLPIPEQQRQQYERQIKSRTRANARLQGHWDVTMALRLGYETLEAIQDQTRRPLVLDRIAEISKPPPRPSPTSYAGTPSTVLKPSPLPKRLPSPIQGKQPPLNSPVLARPYLNISGRRQVPKLVNANRVPILLFKKPQSPFLSALIRHSIKTREKRFSRIIALDKLMQEGRDEDEWDRILKANFGLTELDESWSTESGRALIFIKQQHDAALEKRKRIAKEMTDIVEKEKVLVHEERAALRRRKNRDQGVKLLTRHGREDEAEAEALREKTLSDSERDKSVKAPSEEHLANGATRSRDLNGELETENSRTLLAALEDSRLIEESSRAQLQPKVKRDNTSKGGNPAIKQGKSEPEWATSRERKEQNWYASKQALEEPDATCNMKSDCDAKLARHVAKANLRKVKASPEKVTNEASTKIELAGLGTGLPVRNVGGMSLAEALGEK